MATSFTRQAEAQLNPLFNQQQQAIQSQVPAIQNLYQTIEQGLNQQFQSNLASGVQGITEDASARGVLRSTLPVDARQALTSSLGAALQQSLGQVGAQRAQDIAGINNNLAELGIRRVSSVTDLARALETRDLEKQQFEFQKKQADREFQLAQQQARSSGGGGSTPQWQVKAQLGQSLQADIAKAFRSPQATANSFTERTVLPALYAAYGGVLGNDEINKMVYQYRQNALGF